MTNQKSFVDLLNEAHEIAKYLGNYRPFFAKAHVLEHMPEIERVLEKETTKTPEISGWKDRIIRGYEEEVQSLVQEAKRETEDRLKKAYETIWNGFKDDEYFILTEYRDGKIGDGKLKTELLRLEERAKKEGAELYIQEIEVVNEQFYNALKKALKTYEENGNWLEKYRAMRDTILKCLAHDTGHPLSEIETKYQGEMDRRLHGLGVETTETENIFEGELMPIVLEHVGQSLDGKKGPSVNLAQTIGRPVKPNTQDKKPIGDRVRDEIGKVFSSL